MKPLSISVIKRIAIVECDGEITVDCAYQLKDFVVNSKDKYDAFVIDMSNTTHLSSTGIGALYEVSRIKGHTVVLVIPEDNEPINVVIDIIGLTKVVPWFRTRKDALSYLGEVYP